MGVFDKLFGPPSKDKFAKLLVDAMHKAGETRAIAYDRGEFRLHTEAEKGSIVFLGNAYQEYCSAQPNCGRRSSSDACGIGSLICGKCPRNSRT